MKTETRTVYIAEDGTEYNFAQALIKKAKFQCNPINGEFNGVIVSASPESCVADICEIYALRHELRRLREGK